MIHAGIYPRKSKQMDNSDSMDAQIYMCKNYLDGKYGAGNYVLHIYDGDYGITGHSTKKRKDFQRMMREMVEIPLDIIAIPRYDRIARNTRDFCNIYFDMEQNGCELVSVSQQIDTTTPYGKKFMYDQASMAELEWALCSERRKDANKYARSIGKYNGNPTLLTIGYRVEKIDGINRVVKDEEKEPLIMDLFEHYGQYRNYCACTKYLNEKYDTTLSMHQVRRIIRNEMYKGKWRENDHFCEPYLTVEKWESLQKKVPVIRDDPQKRSEILFSGMMRCPVCGRKMRACNKKCHSGNVYRYYHCEYHSDKRCSFQKCKSEQLLEKMLIQYINDNVSTYGVDAVANEHETALVPNTEAKEKKLRSELDRLNTMYQKGRIDDDYYDREYDRLTSEIAAISKPGKRTDRKKLREQFSGNWEEIYFKLDKLHKKLLWRATIEELIVDEDMKIIDVLFL